MQNKYFFLFSAIAGNIAECFTMHTQKRNSRCPQKGRAQRGRYSAKITTYISTERDAGDRNEAVPEQRKLTPEANELEILLSNKEQSGKLLVAQTAPSVRVAFPELYDEAPGTYPPGLLVASLKALGFDVVLDTNTAADLTICEEGTELLHRITLRQERRMKKMEDPSFLDAMKLDDPLPLFTSCCPGWMNFIANSNPELVPYVSSCKSPHMMLGAM
jgi:iron only hydrogenase large subunit-like protein